MPHVEFSKMISPPVSKLATADLPRRDRSTRRSRGPHMELAIMISPSVSKLATADLHRRAGDGLKHGGLLLADSCFDALN